LGKIAQQTKRIYEGLGEYSKVGLKLLFSMIERFPLGTKPTAPSRCFCRITAMFEQLKGASHITPREQ
jgi:hypothetical protein